MNRLGPQAFAFVAAGVAVAAALLVGGVASSYGSVAIRWGLTGWFVTALAGVAGGAWLVSRHGMPGSPFLVALATCMLTRLILGGAVAIAAAARGTEAMVAYVAGLAAGFIPVQVVEMIWFQRRSTMDQQLEE